MPKNILVAPVVKWVGGKRQLLDQISPFFPKRLTSYCEPFLGGGAVLFSLQPFRAILNDINEDLLSMYEVVRDEVELLIESLKLHINTQDYFYAIRDLDRDKARFKDMSKVEKASRLIYLNKTCYNGLFRVNSAGEFNSPFGYYNNPNIVNASVLRAVNRYFISNKIELYSEDYSKTLTRINNDCFVYLDPPYDPITDTANFTGYNKGGFDRNEQIRLKNTCDELNSRGIKFLLSNSSTDFILDLYKDYFITFVRARRIINSDGKKRGAIEEVLVRNYEPK